MLSFDEPRRAALPLQAGARSRPWMASRATWGLILVRVGYCTAGCGCMGSTGGHALVMDAEGGLHAVDSTDCFVASNAANARGPLRIE